MELADLNSLYHRTVQKEYDWLVEDLSNLLFAADADFFAGSRDTFHAATTKLHSRLTDVPEISNLLDLFLLTRYLLAGNRAPGWVASWLNDHVDWNRHLPGIEKGQMQESRFRAVPVVAVCGEACVRYFVTGLVKGGPDGDICPAWAAALLDQESRDAIRSAVKAALQIAAIPPGGSLYCYPLTVANQRCQFTGSSLGLALAIGFLAVLTDRPIASRLLATGDISDRGEVQPVGSLDIKLKCARVKGFSAFMQPDQERGTPPPPDMEVIPVAKISDAWLIGSLHTPGRGHELLTLLRMLEDPQVFVNNMDHVDDKWIRWAEKLGRLKKVTDAVTESMEFSQRFVDKLDLVLKSWNLQAASTLSALISADRFQRMKAAAPLAAFRLCTLNIALNNHRGNVAGADKWAAVGRKLFPSALKADINACADYLNNRYVSRHNCYTFRSEFPGELADLLACLERRYAVQCDGGCLAEPVLGELYGTIAQNFAFYGPGFLTDFDEYINRSVKAFGDGQVSEYKHQILREFCYQVYAYLDAGLMDRAETALLTYLEVEDWSQLRSKMVGKHFGPFQHAALARFLADSRLGAEKNAYLQWALEHKSSLSGANHPWQLWSHNIARMAQDLGDHESATTMYLLSVKYCLSDQNGPTVKVMTLLPLSGLKTLNALDKADFEHKEKDTLKAVRELDSNYFKLLSENNFDDVLDTVREQPRVLFPFTYR